MGGEEKSERARPRRECARAWPKSRHGGHGGHRHRPWRAVIGGSAMTADAQLVEETYKALPKRTTGATRPASVAVDQERPKNEIDFAVGWPAQKSNAKVKIERTRNTKPNRYRIWPQNCVCRLITLWNTSNGSQGMGVGFAVIAASRLSVATDDQRPGRRARAATVAVALLRARTLHAVGEAATAAIDKQQAHGAGRAGEKAVTC
jgi:hypothetical protein